ncbi:MAG: CDP-alcohol phosphatidyltransferase family protein, partial [Verrucomicrobiota bacterium]
FLVLSAVLVLTFFDWDKNGWSLPLWFALLVIIRDCVILIGIRILYSAKKKVEIRPHWVGKVCTVSLFVVIGWVMLKPAALPPAYPCFVAAAFLIWSMLEYIRQGIRILNPPS